MRTQTIRAEVQRLMRESPFRPFALVMENGQQMLIEHPENIAFQPDNGEAEGSPDFYVLTSNLRVFSTFEAVSTVALADTDG